MKNGVAFGIGIAVGICIVGAYKIYKIIYKKKSSNIGKSAKSLNELLGMQSYVELLTSKELITWFKENMNQFGSDVKMIISMPTKEMVQGLGYYMDAEIDPEKNVLQFFYDMKTKRVLKIRLINYSDIDSNLQAHLIEEDGMIVVKN